MNDNLIRILVVEDHHVVRKGLIALLGLVEGFEVVGEAGDGLEAITQFNLYKPDVTLIDLRLPRLSGVEIIKKYSPGFEASALHRVDNIRRR